MAGRDAGLPVDHLPQGALGIRSSITSGRIARVLFFVHQGQIVLLHGFVKKTQTTPDGDLDLAMKRKKEVEKMEKGSRNEQQTHRIQL